MPRGDKSSYSSKQKRQAEHIEESAKARGYGAKRAAQIGWATVNKQDGGAMGRKKGSRSPVSRSSHKSHGRRTRSAASAQR